MLFKVFFIILALVAILFDEAEPFVHFDRGHNVNYSKFGPVFLEEMAFTGLIFLF